MQINQPPSCNPPAAVAAVALPAVAVAMLALGGARPAAAAMPPGAYITQPAPSAAALGRQVRSRADLRLRYQRAWKLDGPAVVKKVALLKLGRMPETRAMAVYYYRPAEGAYGYKVRRIAKGTPAFVTPDGTPVLLQVCGNPVRPVQSARVSKLKAVKAFDPRESEVGLTYEGIVNTAQEWSGTTLAVPELDPLVEAPGAIKEPLLADGGDSGNSLDAGMGLPGYGVANNKKKGGETGGDFWGFLGGLLGWFRLFSRGGQGVPVTPPPTAVAESPATPSPVYTPDVPLPTIADGRGTPTPGSPYPSPVPSPFAPPILAVEATAAPEPTSLLLAAPALLIAAGVRARRRHA